MTHQHTTEDESFDYQKERGKLVRARREEKDAQRDKKSLAMKKRKGRGPTKSLGKPTLMTLDSLLLTLVVYVKLRRHL